MCNIVEIDSLDFPGLEFYSKLNEAQLLRFREPQPGVFVAESPNVITRALNAGYEPMSFLVEKGQLGREAEEIANRFPEIPVFTAEDGVLTAITGFKLTRGMLAVLNRKKLQAAEALCEKARRVVVLEDVVNPTNVGAIMRSAAALNMDAVLLTCGCSDPLYRRAARVSMGTVFQIPWTFFEKNADYMKKMQEMGFKTVAMALRDESVEIDNEKLLGEEKLAIFMGTEGEGLKSKTIEACDYTVKIPMSNGVDSLNVAAASAVAFWELGKR